MRWRSSSITFGSSDVSVTPPHTFAYLVLQSGVPKDLNTIGFVLIAILFFSYAMLDGFVFGVGMLYLFARGNKERRGLLNAIGPSWMVTRSSPT
jgi:hypothetical protein